MKIFTGISYPSQYGWNKIFLSLSHNWKINYKSFKSPTDVHSIDEILEQIKINYTCIYNSTLSIHFSINDDYYNILLYIFVFKFSYSSNSVFIFWNQFVIFFLFINAIVLSSVVVCTISKIVVKPLKMKEKKYITNISKHFEKHLFFMKTKLEN